MLDRTFSRIGHSVSSSALSNTLADKERNYVRLEWLWFFAKRSIAVRRILDEMLSEGDATPEEIVEAYRDELEEHGRTGREIAAGVKKRIARRRRRRDKPPP